jgi:hypothetical protein
LPTSVAITVTRYRCPSSISSTGAAGAVAAFVIAGWLPRRAPAP